MRQLGAMVRLFSFLALAVMAGTVSFQKAAETSPSAPTSAVSHTSRQVFRVKGIVMKVNPAAKEVEIKHEEIPGYMRAMTMPFDVKDTNELAGLVSGDAVS